MAAGAFYDRLGNGLRRTAALLPAVTVLLFLCTQAEAANLVDARIGVHGDETHFVLEFDEAVPYRTFVLTGPNRAVIDMPDIDWKTDDPRNIANRGIVAGFRYGLFKPGISRVVLDLKAPATIVQHFPLGAAEGSGPRIVLKLKAVSRAEAASVKPEASDGWADYSERVARSSPATQPLAPPSTPGKRVVVIDPGHGGVDPGAIGVSGTHEKKVTLAAAKSLKRVLESTGRYDVILTRDRDIFIPLRDRFQVAHGANAELFISLHADAHHKPDLRGASIYTLSDKASDKEAAALARKENKSDLLAGTDLDRFEADVSSILIELAQQKVNEHSWHFAEMLVGDMARDVRMLRNSHRFAGFAVLKSPNVPSVLIELGYLSNPQDERLLLSEDFRTRISTSIQRAIEKFFARKERLGRS